MDPSPSQLQFGNLTPDLIPPLTAEMRNYDTILARNWLKLLVNDQSLSYFSPTVIDGDPVAKSLPKDFE